MSSLAKSSFLCRNRRNVNKKTNKNISKNYKPGTSKQSKSPTQTEQETMSSCMLNIWKRYRDRGFSKQTSSILLSAWRKNTKCSYTQYIKKWEMYAHKEGLHKISPTLEQALNFLSYLYQCGLSYSAICTARSALSSFLQITDCPNFGSNRFTKLFIKGIFELRPNLPKYQSIWNVDIVLNYLEKLSPVNNICLKYLTFKLVTLIALLSGQRCQTLSLLKLSEMALSDNKCIFHVQSLLKQSRSGKHLHHIEIISYPVNKNLCIITTLKEYISRSSILRSDDQLFLSYKKPHKAVSKETIARWIRITLNKAGINTNKFKPHSTRSASTSAAAAAGASINCIMKAAGWSQESTFRKFYNKDVNVNFGDKILKNYQRN